MVTNRLRADGLGCSGWGRRLRATGRRVVDRLHAGALTRWLALCGMVLALSLGTAALSHAAIVGKDTRRKAPAEYQPIASSIGIVFEKGGRKNRACTAFCVADDVIATNAHCVVGGRGRQGKVRLENVLFAKPLGGPDLLFSTPLKHAASWDPRLSLFAGSYGGRKTIIEFANDWAFAKLDLPICRGKALDIADVKRTALDRLGAQRRLFMLGFHGDLGMRDVMLSGDCRIVKAQEAGELLGRQRRVLRKNGDLFLHTCDHTMGSSGAPILARTPQGLRVVGMNAGSIGVMRRQVRGSRVVEVRTQYNIGVRLSGMRNGLRRFQSERVIAAERDFERIQNLLAAGSHYRGPLDGLFGPQTRGAIASYEQSKGLAPLGTPTQELLASLEADFGAPSPRPPLGDDATQLAAADVGSGLFGAGAPGRTAVQDGLTAVPDEAATITTASRGSAGRADSGNGVVRRERTRLAAVPSPRVVRASPAVPVAPLPAERPAGPAANAPGPSAEPELQERRAERTWSVAAQRELKRLACYTGPIDGIWGPASRSAVARFNARNGTALRSEPSAELTRVLRGSARQRCATRRVVARNRAGARSRARQTRRNRPARPTWLAPCDGQFGNDRFFCQQRNGGRP